MRSVNTTLGENVTGLTTSVLEIDNDLLRSSLVRSAGGLAVHECRMSDPPSQTNLVTEQLVICKDCNRSFRRPGDLKRHKCLSERANLVSEQCGAVQCEHCQ